MPHVYALGFAERNLKRFGRHRSANAAVTSVYVNPRQIENGRFNVNFHTLSRAEWRSSSNMITGMAIGDFRRTGRNRLNPSRTSEIFNGNFLIAVHQADKRLFRFVFENYRLNRRVMIYPQFSRALYRPTVWSIIVGKEFKIDLIF